MSDDCPIQAVTPINIKQLTTGTIEGTGVFDEILKTMQVRLDDQYAKDRIKGTDYSKVYLGSMESAMGQSIAFLMGKDKAYNEALLIQAQVEKTELEKCVVEATCRKIDAEVDMVKQQTLNLEQEYLNLQQEVLKSTQEVLVLEQQVLESVQKVLLMEQQVINAGKEGKILDEQDDKVKAETALLTKQVTKITAEIALMSDQGDKIESDISVNAGQISKLAAETTLVGKKQNTEDQNTKAVQIAKQKTLSEIIINQNKYLNYYSQYDWTTDTFKPFGNGDIPFEGMAVHELELGKQAAIKAHWDGVNVENASYVAQAQILDKVRVYNYITGEYMSEFDAKGIVGAQRGKIDQETALLLQKTTTEYAQTDGTWEAPTDGVPINPTLGGVIGAQIALYNKQRDGFDRNAEVAVAKLYADAYAVQRGTDIGAPTPTTFNTTAADGNNSGGGGDINDVLKAAANKAGVDSC